MKKIIRKPDKFRVKPNMENYEETYKKFEWNNFYDEIEWFEGEKLNAAYNAIDRQTKTGRKDKVALCCEGGNGTSGEYSFLDLQNLSNKFANVLKEYGTQRGDRVFIFLPRILELYVSFLGIIKTGAIASNLFSAFGTNALEDRLRNSSARMLVTNSELKQRVDEIKDKLPELKHVMIVDDEGTDEEIDYRGEMKMASRDFEIERMDPGDPLFMLYTSGTTGKPKGIVHTHYAILQEHLTMKWVLDIHEEDIYWCTADPGWVTGIAYGILGSWSNGTSSVVYEGKFSPEKWYSLIEKHRVTVWYTAPTAIRMLMHAGEGVAKNYDLKSLRHLCSVGEPLNPEAIYWALKVFGLPFHDNWWQTETGGILIANYPTMSIKPGSMGKPFPGIKAGIVDDDGNERPVGKEGNLAIKPPWPSMMKAVWRNAEKYGSYFKKGWYITGDMARMDDEGYFWFIGRADDIIKTAGERVGPFEVESALVEHPAIVEAGVIGKPDPVRGEIIKAFVSLKKGYQPSTELEDDIKKFVKKRLAGHAYPREIEFREDLPKTRSGKIMRRLLKAQDLGLPIGDTSTLEESR
ncbi:MAG TPA: acetate--CoA ligase [Methanocellales archaeon]|nr:acetate--CoA ligase [Methanocellales archaeon]